MRTPLIAIAAAVLAGAVAAPPATAAPAVAWPQPNVAVARTAVAIPVAGGKPSAVGARAPRRHGRSAGLPFSRLDLSLLLGGVVLLAVGAGVLLVALRDRRAARRALARQPVGQASGPPR